MKVSIIIPLYNQKQFVADAIESALAQTFNDIEIVVVNDGSTDSPDEVLDKYKDNIKLVYQENKGLAAARNRGLLESTGEYIQFLDADDIILNDKIERQITAINRNDGINVIPYCGCIRVHNDDLTSSKDFEYQKVENMVNTPVLKIIDLQKHFPLPIHTVLLNKNLIENNNSFDEQMNANEDRLFWTRICLNGCRFIYDNTYGVKYRKHSTSMTTDKNRMFLSHIRYLETVEDLFKNEHEIPLEIKTKLTEVYFGLFYSNIYMFDSEQRPSRLINKIESIMPQNYFVTNSKLKRYLLEIFGIKNYLTVSRILRNIK
jgi:glycosyltransferase involved in cell wall biosynthesis